MTGRLRGAQGPALASAAHSSQHVVPAGHEALWLNVTRPRALTAPKRDMAVTAIAETTAIIQINQIVKWCPGAESNHRHEDFQSTALPLSYPGTGDHRNGRVSGF